MHRLLASIVTGAAPATVRNTIVLVATQAGAAQLRTTLERLVLDGDDDRPRALVLPDTVTREQWYRLMHRRLRIASPWLDELEREVIFAAASAEATAGGAVPPFELRSGLLVEMLSFYDELHRNLKDIDRFERLLVGELEPSAEVDRGAERLLRQTRFLVAAFRAYSRRLDAADVLDEARCLQRLRVARLQPAIEHAIVTVPDVVADRAAGLWPADFDLLSRLEGLARVDVVATDAVLDAGFRDRLDGLLPGAEDVRWTGGDAAAPGVQPAEPERTVLAARDREEELVGFARALKRAAVASDAAGCRAVPGRVALVFQRPLPYLYLAERVLGGAGIPFATVDALPLAAEPFAASVEAVFECVDAGLVGSSLLPLLRDPNFSFVVDGARVERDEISALHRLLEPGPPNDLRPRLRALTEVTPDASPADVGRAARAALGALEELSTLTGEASASTLLERLLGFLESHAPDPAAGSRLAERLDAARAAVIGAIRVLRDAHHRYGDEVCTLADVAERVRRWIEAQTFAPPRGGVGVQLLDARAARYGDFDTVRLVGLVEDEWPDRPRRNIFYPGGLLAQLGWSNEADRFAAGRAEFVDLLHLARDAVSLSVFTLDEDRLIGPSPLLDDLPAMELSEAPFLDHPLGRISIEEGLAMDPVTPDVVSGLAADWLAVRRSRRSREMAVFHGQSLPMTPRAHSVTSVEQYLDCPFQYFAQRVLRIDAEPDEAAAAALERGRFVHELLGAFFSAWQAAGRTGITPETIGEARRLFDRLARQRTDALPAPDRAIERRRVLGSALAVGVGEQIFRMELEWPGRVVERLLEFSLDGTWNLGTPDAPRPARVRGVADRIDLLADGSFWVLDYKTGRVPSRRRAVQLPVYAACAEQRLRGHRGRDWHAGGAAYVALGERQPYVPLAQRPSDVADRLAEGRARFLGAVARMEGGRFPPSPADLSLCGRCAYGSVCRKEYVGDI